MNYPQLRLKRLRKTESLRNMFNIQTFLPSQIIYPLFIIEGNNSKNVIPSMPNQFQISVDMIEVILSPLVEKGLGGVLLFGIPFKNKDSKGTLAYNKNNPINRAIQTIKNKFPNLIVFTDVCLCSYTNHGHCGILDKFGNIDNDLTLEILSKISLMYADNGADAIAPSAMADGQVKIIRNSLELNGFKDTIIMSYSTKFLSNLYGPFRDIANSKPNFGNRKSYQIDPLNLPNALNESILDEAEGADILMVKPSLFYLDVIAKIKAKSLLPVAAYNVSGEYTMIYDYCKKGHGDLKTILFESLGSIKRAGADILITYWANEFLNFF